MTGASGEQAAQPSPAPGGGSEAAPGPTELPRGGTDADPDGPAAAPQRAGLLAQSLPAEETPLDVALRQLCEQLDDIGQGLSDVLARDRRLDWLLAVTLGATALEATRRYARSSRPGLAVAGAADEGTLTWVPDLPHPLGAEER
jgi:hypothetical protein